MALIGHSLSGATGSWFQGEISFATGRRVGAASVRGGGGLFGLHYMDPFAYDAAGVDLRAGVAVPTGAYTFSVSPVLTLGAWSTDRVEGDLQVAGADAQVERSLGPLRAALSAGVLRADNGATRGTFLRGGATVSLVRERWTAAVRLVGQQNPLETETGGAAVLVGVLRPGVELRLQGGRSVRDPLFGTQGTWSFRAGVSVRPVRWHPPAPPPVVAVGPRTEGGRRVRLTLRAPDAERVEVTGDFTAWEPVPMERTDAGWQWDAVVAAGLHHFGFLVDGEWALPPDAPGVVDDGWGRQNASFVVEP